LLLAGQEQEGVVHEKQLHLTGEMSSVPLRRQALHLGMSGELAWLLTGFTCSLNAPVSLNPQGIALKS